MPVSFSKPRYFVLGYGTRSDSSQLMTIPVLYKTGEAPEVKTTDIDWAITTQSPKY